MHTFTLPSGIEIDLVEMTGVEEDLLTNRRLMRKGRTSWTSSRATGSSPWCAFARFPSATRWTSSCPVRTPAAAD